MKKKIVRTGIFLAGFAFFLLAAGWLNGCATDRSVSYTLSAKSSTERGQHDEAIKQARQSIESNPHYAPGWYWLGVAQFRQGRYDDAITAFKKVVELKPIGEQWISSHSFLGWCYYWKKDYDEGLKYFHQALKINPQYYDSLKGRGWTHYRKKVYDLAIRDFSQAIGINQKDQDALIGRGWAYLEESEFHQAMADLNKVLELDPKKFLALRSRGWCYYRMKSYDQAVEDFNRALEVNHNDPNTFWGRGYAHLFKGQYREAIEDFNGVNANLDPRIADNHFILQDSLRGKAYAYLGLGDGETAVSLIRKAKEVLDYNVNHDLAIIHYTLGNKEKAWEARGGGGMVGLEVRNYKKGAVSGVEVVRFVPGGPAENSGILPGDVMLRINEIGVHEVNEFVKKTIRLSPGSKATVRILREGRERDIFLPVASAEPLMEAIPVVASILSKKKERPAAIAAKSEPRDIPPTTEKLPPLRNDTHAIVIGIDYEQRKDIPPLLFASQDARRIYDILTNPRFGGVAQENAFLLLNEKATRNEIVAALRKIRNWDGYVYVYYSGHGAPKTKEDKLVDGLLVPSDAIITDPDSLEETSIKISYLQDLVEKSPAKVFVALDACFSGGGKSIVPKGGKPLVGMLLTADLLKPKATGKIILTSSAMNQQSWEDEKELKGGIFSHFLIEGLKGKASKDAWIQSNDLVTYIRENVPRVARKLKGVEQIPQVSGQGNFPVARNWEKAKFIDVETGRAKLKGAFENGLITPEQLSRALDELKSPIRSKTLEAFFEGKIEAGKFGELY